MSETPLLGLEVTAQDARIHDLCTRYWKQNEDGKYAYQVKKLAEEFGSPVYQFVELVAANSVVQQEDGICGKCGITMFRLAKSREAAKREKWGGERSCKDCHDEQLRLLREKQQQEVEAKPVRMRDAFERAVWHSLSPLELNLLICLLNSSNLHDAYRKVGLSDSRGNKIFEKLFQMDLIGFNPEENAYYFDEALSQALAGLSFQRRIKSIFGSPRALELYRTLKTEHAFVFPEIPVCAFVERSCVSHLFTEPWHTSYFLTCRIDFVVCDADGKPTQVFEYQGSYHSGEDQRTRDTFKRQLLEEVGLPLYAIDSQSG